MYHAIVIAITNFGYKVIQGYHDWYIDANGQCQLPAVGKGYGHGDDETDDQIQEMTDFLRDAVTYLLNVTA